MRDLSRWGSPLGTARRAGCGLRSMRFGPPSENSNQTFARSHRRTDPLALRLPATFPSNALNPGRVGFTLLEVILALAILAGALASLGEVVRLSGENAMRARDLTTAQLLAASKLAEITSGAEQLSTLPPTPLDLEDAETTWLYSVQWDPTDVEDIIVVQVRVEQNPDEVIQPVQCTLVRWMPDPGAMPIEAETGTGASSSSSSSDSGSEGG